MPNFKRYKIKRFTEEQDVAPEETLADSLSKHSTIEMPIGGRVVSFSFLLATIVFSFFVFRAFQLQIIKGNQLASLARKAGSVAYPLSGLRGIIFDAKGGPLVQNAPVFDLLAVRPHIPKEAEEVKTAIQKLNSVLGLGEEKLLDIFVKNENIGAFIVEQGLTKTEALGIQELGLKGIFVITNTRRDYLDGPATAHLLGYTSIVTEEELERDQSYFLTDKIGRLGIEAQYETLLRGERRFFDPTSDLNNQTQPPRASNLVLNVDGDIQRQLYKITSEVFRAAGVKKGAVIVQNPKTGAVLGMLSMPSFDGNVFEQYYEEGNGKKIKRILSDSGHPFLNRVISGKYSPGSTIKPLLALAGLKEGIVTPSTLIYADGAINVQSEVDPAVFYTFRDWKVHGWTDIKKAIADSVDVYFYALGGGYKNISGLGIDKIAQYLKIFKADQSMGIDLPGEAKGFVPTREWKKEAKGEGWYAGDNYNISIGQGDLLITPIWLNAYVGAIANGGKLMEPHILREVQDADGVTVDRSSSTVIGEIPFSSEELDIIRSGMRQAVLSGTASMLKDLPVPVAAKTGTAQVTSRGLNSLFTVFGPYDDPEIAMTVLVENINQSQGLAIRIANDFLSWYFAKLSKSKE